MGPLHCPNRADVWLLLLQSQMLHAETTGFAMFSHFIIWALYLILFQINYILPLISFNVRTKNIITGIFLEVGPSDK